MGLGFGFLSKPIIQPTQLGFGLSLAKILGQFFGMNLIMGFTCGCIPKICFLGTVEVVKICRDWFGF